MTAEAAYVPGRYCPRCGFEHQPKAEPCTAERWLWDEDDAGHHCRASGPHTVHVCVEHGCLWTDEQNALVAQNAEGQS